MKDIQVWGWEPPAWFSFTAGFSGWGWRWGAQKVPRKGSGDRSTGPESPSLNNHTSQLLVLEQGSGTLNLTMFLLQLYPLGSNIKPTTYFQQGIGERFFTNAGFVEFQVELCVVTGSRLWKPGKGHARTCFLRKTSALMEGI